MYRGTRARVYHSSVLCVKPTGHSTTQCLTAWSRALGSRVDRHAAHGGQHTPQGPVEAGPHAGQALGRLVAQVSGECIPGSVYGCMSLRLCAVGHMPIASMPYAYALPCLMNECWPS